MNLSHSHQRFGDIVELMIDSRKRAQTAIENNPKGTLLVSITIGCWILLNVPLAAIPDEMLRRIVATLAPPSSVTLTVIMLWLVYKEAAASNLVKISGFSDILRAKWESIRAVSGIIEVVLMIGAATAGMAVSTVTTVVFATMAIVVYMVYFALVIISTFGIIRDAVVEVY